MGAGAVIRDLGGQSKALGRIVKRTTEATYPNKYRGREETQHQSSGKKLHRNGGAGGVIYGGKLKQTGVNSRVPLLRSY